MPKKRSKDAPETSAAPGNEDWRAHSDAEALMHAEEVRSDRSRHSAAQAHLRKKAKLVGRAMTGGKRKQASRRQRLEKVEL